MAELPLFDGAGKKIGTIEIDEKVFGDRVHRKLLHQVVVAYEANKRQGTHRTKSKAEVEGSSRKPWPQKYTGRARHGMIRSPIWRHGGHAHALRPRDYRQTINKSMRETSLNSALLGKILDKEVHVIETLSFGKPKTKEMAKLLQAIGFQKSVLIANGKYDKNTYLSARNIPKVRVLPVAELNAYELLKHKDVLFTRDALEAVVKARKGEVKVKK